MQCEKRPLETEGLLDFRPIELEDKEVFDSFIKPRGYNCSCSESSFANNFIWRKRYNVQVAFRPDVMYIFMHHELYRPLLLPPFLRDNRESIRPYMLECEAYMEREQGGFFMKGATGAVMEKIQKDCGGRYVFQYDEYNSEYVYRTRDLIDLSGKKYHSKRNHVNAFLRKYESGFAEYSAKYRDECLALQGKWAQDRGVDEETAADEYDSIRSALDHYRVLGLKGCVVLVEGRVVAFSVGERVSEDTALIHIEKAERGYDGLYAYINHEFAANFWSDCAYINREEDMGVPGIRKAKRSYHPAFMIDKYDIAR